MDVATTQDPRVVSGDMKAVKPPAQPWVLTAAALEGEKPLDAANRIVPRPLTLKMADTGFQYDFPAHSLTV